MSLFWALKGELEIALFFIDYLLVIFFPEILFLQKSVVSVKNQTLSKPRNPLAA